MSAEVCRQVFVRCMEGCDLGVVQGQFASGMAEEDATGGSLNVLCEWLDLPRLAIVDVSRLGTCRLPQCPPQADGLLLDRVCDDCHAAEITTNLETIWGIPVVGAIGCVPRLRQQIAALPSGVRPPRDLCRELGGQFFRYGRSNRVLGLSRRREWTWASPRRPCTPRWRSRVVVALAYDPAFDCYFSDTLDLLESRGASIVDFSPLQDDRLPDRTDIVYFGCGHPERYAEELSQNHCMKLALRNHLRSGGRFYAEGGGVAYLCHHLEMPHGPPQRMAGIFPAIAQLHPSPVESVPVEVTLQGTSWLGEPGTRLRGYRNPMWSLRPIGAVASYVAQPEHRYDLIGVRRAIGSQLHLHFAVQPHLLPQFFQPPFRQPGPADPWTVAS